ncbi:hypothetical protein BHE74_00044800 [Ensete ventricosum]|nr:hypothetical protein BHE74_00044800 [Ensete ventricosum]
MLWVFHRVQWICIIGFGLLAREALHAGNPRSVGVDALVVTLIRVLLTSLGHSYKTIPPGWWVPGEVPPTIKLGSIGRMKSDILLERQSFFSFWIEVERESVPALRETLGDATEASLPFTGRSRIPPANVRVRGEEDETVEGLHDWRRYDRGVEEVEVALGDDDGEGEEVVVVVDCCVKDDQDVDIGLWSDRGAFGALPQVSYELLNTRTNNSSHLYPS